MLYTKSKNSFKAVKKAMQKWGKKSKNVTFEDPLHKWWTSSFLELKTTQEHQEQPSCASVPREGVMVGVCAQK